MSVAIQAQGITKRYRSVRALNGLDLEVETGALFGLLGPNGAGKSTAFGILCGWLSADSGEANVLGEDVRQLHRLQGRVAALPQDAFFPKQVSLRDQLTHFARLLGQTAAKARQDADRVLELVGLEDSRKARSHELSHGMNKRASLAQALLGSPEVVFLDEPTAGLDPRNARAIKDLMSGLVPRTTVVVSSHNLAEIQEMCSHAAILNQGTLRYNGRVDELTRTRGEIFFEFAEGPLPPVEALQVPLNVETRVSTGVLEIRFDDSRESAEVIRGVVEILYQYDVKLVGVRRGVSLEGAFLELTREGPKD